MNVLPHLAARLFGTPLLIHRPKLDVILSVLGARIGLNGIAAPAGFVPPAHPIASQPSAIAVIPIYGTLVRRTVGLEAESGLSSYSALSSQIDAVLADPGVSGILLDIDSPGGESSGVFDLADHIRAASAIKPIWAVANDMAFSAAYALASAANKVFVSRTGRVGSIGVIAMHADESARDMQEGVRYTTVFAGERKNDLNPHAPITSEAQAYLQSEVDRVYELFIATIAKHRGISVDAVRGTQAALLPGPQAVTLGFADALGSFDEALAQLAQSLNRSPLSPANTNVLGISTNQRKPTTMNQPSAMQPDVPVMADAPQAEQIHSATPAAAPIQTAAVPSAASNPFTVNDAVEIAQTCTLAGRSDLIAGFLETKVSPAKVRSQLLTAQVQASPEITSRIDPNAAFDRTKAAANPASAENPLIQAVKARMAAK